LKQLPQYPPGVPPVVEVRVLTHLQNHGIPVALPILTDHGTLHITVNERAWTLLPYLPHQRSDFELGPDAAATAAAVGAAIGSLDRALADYPWPVDSFVDDAIKVVTDALPQLPPEATQLIQPFIDLLHDTCAGPTQLTHGDCNDGNVLIDQGRVTGVIDIDHLPTGPRVRDVAYYLASRLSTHLAAHGPAAAAAARAMAAVFTDYITGYQQIHPLTDQERQAIVPLMLITEIGGAHWALHGWEANTANYRGSLRSITWITDHLASLM
jgi:Ser/Thr protein kinase RdoA (MazF antagonist)